MDASRMQVLDLAYGAVSQLQTLLERQGRLEVVDGKLFAGGAPLDNPAALVQRVKAELGFGCTIFQGNVRIATTALAKDSDEVILDTCASEKITQQVYRRGERFKGIAHIIGKNWVIVYVPLRDHQGKIVGMLAAFRELVVFLTELESLDGTSEALVLHSPEGRVVDANRTACDMLALSRRELLDKSMHDFTTCSEQALRAAWTTIDVPIRLETFWRRSDLFSFPVELAVGPSEIPGSPLLLTIARDFTEQHAARERLRALNAQLVQSEKMAALGKLVAGVTHDVNTPLGAIRSGHQTMASAVAKLRKGLGDQPAALDSKGIVRPMRVIEQTIETVAVGTDRINEVLQRLRSFARLDQGSLQDVDLRTCVEDVLTLVEHKVPEAVTVRCELDDLPRLRCYPAEVNQLIMNLVVNAIDAVGDSGTIAVCALADDEYLELVVEDDGEGIPAPDLPNIFNPGFTTRGVGFGGGLGLAIAYQVAQLHNGSISVESSHGAGARFTTRLPLMGVVAANYGDGI
jgi:PAS domain S-box-containing protein